MKLPIFGTPACKSIAGYLCAIVLCLVILTITLKLWRADIHVPFAYSCDSLFTQLWVKGTIENGWYLHNDRVGVPGVSDLRDYPMADNFHFALLKALALLSSDTAVVFNLFYLLSFPLVAVSCLLVLRQLGLSFAVATVIALLYTFLPYHFLRGLSGHLFLMSYFMIPPVVLVGLWVGLPGRSFCNVGAKAEDCVRAPLSRRRWWFSLLVCILISSTGIYYAFFGCVLLFVAGLFCLGQRNYPGFRTALGLIATVCLGVVLNVLPSIIYRNSHGPNPDAVLRTLQGPEVFGMKITQLVLPMSAHRVKWLAEIKQAYNHALPSGSGDFGYLGVVGVLGFFLLLGRLLRRPRRSVPGVLDLVQIFNICAVLLATTGGLGMVGSLFVGSWLRCFERMSIVIAFLSLLAVGVGAERMIERSQWLNRSRLLLSALLGCVLAAGIWEQSSGHFAPKYATITERYAQDAAFIRHVETNFPDGASIFQLPYMPFPEQGSLCRMGDYDPLRGYLHSTSLRWSYGAVKGRAGDAWLKQVASMPAEKLVQTITAAGIDGIYLDRFGYEDNGARIEDALTQLLGGPTQVSRDGRLCFFALAVNNPSLKAAMLPKDAKVGKWTGRHP